METYEVTVRMTFKDKIINFWYHYKWQTIITIFVLIVLGVCIGSCAAKPKADLKIVYVSEVVLLENQKAELKEFLSTKIEDYNGNGKAEIDIIEIDLYPNNPAMQNSSVQRLLAELVIAENYFFLVDKVAFDLLDEKSAFSDISDICSNTVENNKALLLPRRILFKTITDRMPENYYATLRINGEGVTKLQASVVKASKELLINLDK